MIFLFFQSSFLRLFLEKTGAPGAQAVATQWVIRSIVIALVVAGLMLGFKALRKYMADVARKRVWTRGQTWLLIVIGFAPVFIILWLNWWMTFNFLTFVGNSGLFSGVLLGWLVYLITMILGHLVSPWRRELI